MELIETPVNSKFYVCVMTTEVLGPLLFNLPPEVKKLIRRFEK